MAVNLKVLILVTGIAGSCIATPLILWKTNNLGISKTQPISPSKPLDELTSNQDLKINQESGNCQVIEDLEDILRILRKNKDDYITIFCKDTNTDSNADTRLKDNWTGLFPSVLFINIDNLTEGKKFDIKTQTKLFESGNYQTIFSGSRFDGFTVTGEWGDKSINVIDKSITTIKVTSDSSISDPIYLVYPKSKEN